MNEMIKVIQFNNPSSDYHNKWYAHKINNNDIKNPLYLLRDGKWGGGTYCHDSKLCAYHDTKEEVLDLLYSKYPLMLHQMPVGEEYEHTNEYRLPLKGEYFYNAGDWINLRKAPFNYCNSKYWVIKAKKPVAESKTEPTITNHKYKPGDKIQFTEKFAKSSFYLKDERKIDEIVKFAGLNGSDKELYTLKDFKHNSNNKVWEGHFELYNPTKTMNTVIKDSLNNLEEPDKNGWVTWYGGKCPVDPNTMVDIKLKNKIGASNYKRNYLAKYLCWQHHIHDIHNQDIIAYKIIKVVDNRPKRFPAPKGYQHTGECRRVETGDWFANSQGGHAHYCHSQKYWKNKIRWILEKIDEKTITDSRPKRYPAPKGFEHTGECRKVKKGDWFAGTVHGTEILSLYNKSDKIRWILRPINKKSVSKSTKNNIVCHIGNFIFDYLITKPAKRLVKPVNVCLQTAGLFAIIGTICFSSYYMWNHHDKVIKEIKEKIPSVSVEWNK